jgi:hypothetical protein
LKGIGLYASLFHFQSFDMTAFMRKETIYDSFKQQADRHAADVLSHI